MRLSNGNGVQAVHPDSGPESGDNVVQLLLVGLFRAIPQFSKQIDYLTIKNKKCLRVQDL